MDHSGKGTSAESRADPSGAGATPTADREVESLERLVNERLTALKKVKDRLAKARQEMGKGKPASKLRALIADLRALPESTWASVDPESQLTALERQLRHLSEGYESSLRSELKRLADGAQFACKPLPDGMALGPFALNLDLPKESASLSYAKVPVVKELPLDAAQILKVARDEATRLLEPPKPKAVAEQLDEAMRVVAARQKRQSVRVGEARVELPAVYREMCFIKQCGSEKSPAYSLARFAVELKALIQSDENLTGPRRFRLETAVLENTKDSRKSLFIPNEVASGGYGEGTFYQAVVLVTPGT